MNGRDIINILIEKVNLHVLNINYDPNVLVRWRQRDEAIVPKHNLDRQGQGVSNSYGFGEMLAENFFSNMGYVVLNNNFDLLSATSQFNKINNAILSMIGVEQVINFKRYIKYYNDNSYKVKQPDLFVFNKDEHFFVEVKKDKDRFNEGQFRFIYLARKYLDCDTRGIHFYGDNIIRPDNVVKFMEVTTLEVKDM